MGRFQVKYESNQPGKESQSICDDYGKGLSLLDAASIAAQLNAEEFRDSGRLESNYVVSIMVVKQ